MNTKPHTDHCKDGSIILPSLDEMERAARFLRTLGDPTKLKIVCTLISGEVCAGGIAAALDMTKSAVSHQLRILREEGLIKARRDGKHVIYSLDDDHVHEVLNMTLQHIHHRREASAGQKSDSLEAESCSNEQ